jgi:hypothetical protein
MDTVLHIYFLVRITTKINTQEFEERFDRVMQSVTLIVGKFMTIGIPIHRLQQGQFELVLIVLVRRSNTEGLYEGFSIFMILKKRELLIKSFNKRDCCCMPKRVPKPFEITKSTPRKSMRENNDFVSPERGINTIEDRCEQQFVKYKTIIQKLTKNAPRVTPPSESIELTALY